MDTASSCNISVISKRRYKVRNSWKDKLGRKLIHTLEDVSNFISSSTKGRISTLDAGKGVLTSKIRTNTESLEYTETTRMKDIHTSVAQNYKSLECVAKKAK